MANQHMISAASSLERALSDIQTYRNELQTNLDNTKRTSNDRLKQIDNEIHVLNGVMSKTDKDQEKAQAQNQIRQLEQEREQIHQAVADEERHVSQQFSYADQNTADIRVFVQRLQMMA